MVNFVQTTHRRQAKAERCGRTVRPPNVTKNRLLQGGFFNTKYALGMIAFKNFLKAK